MGVIFHLNDHHIEPRCSHVEQSQHRRLDAFPGFALEVEAQFFPQQQKVCSHRAITVRSTRHCRGAAAAAQRARTPGARSARPRPQRPRRDGRGRRPRRRACGGGGRGARVPARGDPYRGCVPHAGGLEIGVRYWRPSPCRDYIRARRRARGERKRARTPRLHMQEPRERVPDLTQCTLLLF